MKSTKAKPTQMDTEDSVTKTVRDRQQTSRIPEDVPRRKLGIDASQEYSRERSAHFQSRERAFLVLLRARQREREGDGVDGMRRIR